RFMNQESPPVVGAFLGVIIAGLIAHWSTPEASPIYMIVAIGALVILEVWLGRKPENEPPSKTPLFIFAPVLLVLALYVNSSVSDQRTLFTENRNRIVTIGDSLTSGIPNFPTDVWPDRMVRILGQGSTVVNLAY